MESLVYELLSFSKTPFIVFENLLESNIKISFEYENKDKETIEYIDENSAKYVFEKRNEYIEEGSYKDKVRAGIAKEKRNGKFRNYQYIDGKKENLDIVNMYLDIEKDRVNMDRLDEDQLFDLNKGHWDLEDIEGFEKEVGEKGYYRDPALDIKEGGVVGIDFGTKSTVVVYQEDNNRSYPMRISGNNLSGEIADSDYENPTVIEFKNIIGFMEDYNAKIGRPATKWEDVTVSHTALKDLYEDPAAIYSIIDDLKQWSASNSKKLMIRDKKGVEQEILPYLELKDGDIDPIEIYAYYIGSYINNMTNGIFLEYLLSFPVTYELDIRNKILESFRRGIKKSLPKQILENEEIMKRFRVKHGANEPAAYIISAFEEYGFEPDEDEPIYYGVFDFGGGTTDFDFGIFRESEDEFDFDFDLEHFHAGGLKYLGGENILQELAYVTFKGNQKELRENNIRFEMPEYCEKDPEVEMLTDNSQGAKLNTKILANKFREFWEDNGSLEDTMEVVLYNKDGESKLYNLKVDEERLSRVIKNRISYGVNNFFIAMNEAFAGKDVEEIKIFLAGNSSKHRLVKELFEEKIAEIEDRELELYPALKTPEAEAIIRDLGIEINDNKFRPSGKTGVAYGLVNSNRINIVSSDEEDGEINFKYYVGFSKRNKLKVVLDPTTGYNNFQKIANVRDHVIRIYYSSLSSGKNKLSIDDIAIKRKNIYIDNELDIEEKDYELWIKAVKPSRIGWVVCEKGKLEENAFVAQGEVELD